MFKNIREDIRTYKYNFGAQGLWVMLVYRFGRWKQAIGIRILRMPFSLIYSILFKLVQILTGIELPCEARVGRNFKIDHFGDIIISGFASFGDNCRIRNGVSVGLKNVENPAGPTIGNNVDIGAGAKILGAVKIGDNVKIGANAVVITDIPSNSVAVGVPAKVVKGGSV